MSRALLVILVLLCTIMFFLSGINKIFDFDGNVDRTARKLGYNGIITQAAIIIAIVIEIVAPLLLVYWAVSGSMSTAAMVSALSLALFTFLATMIYYMPVNKYYYQFFSNTTTFGCMLLLAYFISKKC
jgi:uncharacterized membrane protein YphA (DoxX/SURF4 family)